MERNWKLNDDLITKDNALDPITFDDIILAVHCNCRVVNHATIIETADEILKQRLEDFKYLIMNNIRSIVKGLFINEEARRCFQT